MVLEATVILVDNSEYMANGDYTPTRMEAQKDAANLIATAKTQSNPENSVGLISIAGKNPNVLVTMTSDNGKIMHALHGVPISSQIHFSTAIQIAQLALKHRQNKNQKQRIIVFIASPILDGESVLVQLAKKLKKNNIAVDVISFGEETKNQQVLESFIRTVNANDNSHLVSIPPGPHILSDVILSSPIVSGEDGLPPPGLGAGGGDFGFENDPEMAEVLRMSLEEEKQRQDRLQQSETSGSSAQDELLRQALLAGTSNSKDMELTEEEEIARAIEMSMKTEDKTDPTDANLLNSVLGNLPGVNTSDPRIQNAIKDITKKKKDDKKHKDDNDMQE